MSVCWCAALPDNALSLKSKVFILQHPLEEKRNLRTARIIEVGCGDKCTVIKGRKFNSTRHPELAPWITDERDKTIVLYPGPNATPLESVPHGEGFNIVVIDGTWKQAKSMYSNSPELHSLRKVEVHSNQPSTYVIRTQPMEGCLSTVETVALALVHLESNPSIYTILMNPLNALCNFQLECGASKHHSREYLVLHGMYDKPVPKELRRKLKGVIDITQNGINHNNNEVEETAGH